MHLHCYDSLSTCIHLLRSIQASKPHCHSSFSRSSKIRKAPPRISNAAFFPARSKAILVACICIVMTVAVSSLSEQGHHNPRMLVLLAFEDCGVIVFLISFVVVAVVVCVTHTFETSPSIRIFNSCIDVQRSSMSTTSANFCYNFKQDRAGIVNLYIPAIHSTFLTFFCWKWLLIVIWKHQLDLLEKWLLLQK